MPRDRDKPLSTNPATVAARKHQAKQRARRQALFDNADMMMTSEESKSVVVSALAGADVTAEALAGYISRGVRRDSIDYMKAVFGAKLSEKWEELLDKAHSLAMDGDPVLLLGLMKFTIPIPRPTGQKTDLGVTKPPETPEELRTAGMRAVKAVYSGEITPEDGGQMIHAAVMMSDEINRTRKLEMEAELHNALINNHSGKLLDDIRKPSSTVRDLVALHRNGEFFAAPADIITSVDADIIEDDEGWKEFL